MSSPAEGSESARLMYLMSIACARRSVKIANAYFVPDDLSVQTLVDAVNSALTTVKTYSSNAKGSTAALKGDFSLTSLSGELLQAVGGERLQARVPGAGAVGVYALLDHLAWRFVNTHGWSVCAATALSIRSHGTLSKNFRMSTSKTQPPRQSISWFRKESNAWCADRPGRKPYEQSKKSCS